MAVKEIPVSTLTTQQATDHVMNERKILAALTESNVGYASDLIGTLKTESSIFLVMEFVQGELLTDFLKRKTKLTEAETRSIITQVLDILADLHSRRIIYRDLKLTNLIIHEARLRLIDYGLSKIVGVEGRTRSICGTVHAMAPELVSPLEGGYSFEIDCWALGVLLFELCEFRAPFGYARTEADFLQSPESLEFRRTEDVQLQELIQRLLTADVNDRFTLEDVRRHPWMKYQSSPVVQQVPKSLEDDTSFWDTF